MHGLHWLSLYAVRKNGHAVFVPFVSLAQCHCIHRGISLYQLFIASYCRRCCSDLVLFSRHNSGLERHLFHLSQVRTRQITLEFLLLHSLRCQNDYSQILRVQPRTSTVYTLNVFQSVSATDCNAAVRLQVNQI